MVLRTLRYHALQALGLSAMLTLTLSAQRVSSPDSVLTASGPLGFRVHYTTGWRYPVIDSIIPGSMADRSGIVVGDSLVVVTDMVDWMKATNPNYDPVKHGRYSILVMHGGRAVAHLVDETMTGAATGGGGGVSLGPVVAAGGLSENPIHVYLFTTNAHGSIDLPPLGLRMHYNAGASHAIIDSILPGGPAATAGAMKGDSVITMEGLKSQDGVHAPFRELVFRPGVPQQLVVSRAGKWLVLVVTSKPHE